MKYKKFEDFKNSNNGNFAMMTALLSAPVLAGAIMMVEYSNLADNHARLQNAVDAAALYVGHHEMEYDEVPSDSDVFDFVAANFDGNLKEVRITDNKPTRSNNGPSGEYGVEAVSVAPRYFLSGVSALNYVQTATAFVPKSELSNVAVALVLDNTTSMNGDKISTLREEATDFIDKIKENATDPNTVRVALVPFHRLVNVGTAHRNEAWINIDPDHMDDWNGCVGLRRFDYTYEHEYKYAGGDRAKFRALLDTECTEPITPLTNNWDLLRDNISELRTVRGTYVAVGAMWGLSVLSPSVPFTEVTELDDPARVMIIMADGDNTRSLSPAEGSQTNEGPGGDDSDEQTELACNEAKMEGVTVYSIAFGNSISQTGMALLKKCASQPTHYFKAGNAEELKATFKEIRRKITRLRLTG